MGSVGPFVSVYVDNLPFEMDIVWLSHLFRGFGEVVDVYIPKKRSSRFNTKFGFVRFKSKEEALRAVQALHGIRIRDFNIQVNLARYSQARGSRNLLQSSNVFITSGRNSKASVYQVKRSGNTNLVDDSCPSYADIVAGKNASSIRPSIKVHIDDNQWLLRSAVAKLPSQRSVESLREAFISDGVWNIQIRPMGDSEGKSEGEKEVNVEVDDVLVETNDLSDMGENFQVLPPIAEVAFDDGVVGVNGENDKVSTCSDKTKVEADDLVIAKESVGKNCEDPLMKDFVLDPDKLDMGSFNEPHEGSNNDEGLLLVNDRKGSESRCNAILQGGVGSQSSVELCFIGVTSGLRPCGALIKCTVKSDCVGCKWKLQMAVDTLKFS
ncbi:hypothetical protein Vadar_020823 [Vaccinium darrowii]|uniref:Uncharacterized protein n=1 Tax=Vaccinium darrowii TaxID=229202 RepID=A0ACB7Y0S1_9ERIC|nr:hypothetical protein Vadar_020823 [Vaccinium darrowii]